MVEIQIQDKKYEIPTEWKDITLEWWCGLYTIIKKHTKITADDENNEVKEKKLEEVEVLRMNRDVFKYLTGVNDTMLQKLDLESVNQAVTTVSELLQEYLILSPEMFWFQDDLNIAPYGYGNTFVSNTFHHYCLNFQKPV